MRSCVEKAGQESPTVIPNRQLALRCRCCTCQTWLMSLYSPKGRKVTCVQMAGLRLWSKSRMAGLRLWCKSRMAAASDAGRIRPLLLLHFHLHRRSPGVSCQRAPVGASDSCSSWSLQHKEQSNGLSVRLPTYAVLRGRDILPAHLDSTVRACSCEERLVSILLSLVTLSIEGTACRVLVHVSVQVLLSTD